MALLGHTTIELTNVNTGEVEIYEDDNIVTNAVDMLYTSQVANCVPPALSQYMVPGYTTRPPVHDLFGGLMLFSEAIEENPDNYDMPNCECVGCAAAGYVQHSAAKLGSYSSTESGAIEGGYKFVYDFETFQANGEIASVCLTPIQAGKLTYGQSVGEFTSLINDTNFSYITIQSHPVLCSSTAFGRYQNSFDFYPSVNGDMYPFYDDNYVYGVKLYNLIYNSKYPTNHISSTGKLTLQKRSMNIREVNVFEHMGGHKSYETIDIPIEGSFSAGVSYTCQYVNDHLYVFAIKDVNVGETMTIYKIHVDTHELVTTFVVTNDSEYNWVRNYISGNVQILSNDRVLLSVKNTSVNNYLYMLILDLKNSTYKIVTYSDGVTPLVMYGGYNTLSVTTDNTIIVTCSVYYPGATSYKSSQTLIINSNTGRAYQTQPLGLTYANNYGNLRGRHNIPYYNLHNIGAKKGQNVAALNFSPFMLMTINNLSSPVIKTEDKTMKITYTLYEDTGTT